MIDRNAFPSVVKHINRDIEAAAVFPLVYPHVFSFESAISFPLRYLHRAILTTNPALHRNLI
jgi:hypothetical protein